MTLLDTLEKPKKILKKVRFKIKFARKKDFSERYALPLLNVTQMLSVLNDSLFKFTAIFFLLDLKGEASRASVLFLMSVIFILPFLLFSSWCGILADRYSKQKVIRFAKGLEVVLMTGAIFIIHYQIESLVYPMMFLITTQSVILSPAKYSIVPELFPKEKISRANGILNSSSYGSMIIGSFLASRLTDLTGRNFTLIIGCCLLFALIGFATSLYIPYTRPIRSKKKMKAFFIGEIYQTLKATRRIPMLNLCVFGAAFFLFYGAFLQLNVIPFAIEALGSSDTEGGYIFTGASVGIALGSLLAGRLLRGKEIELGLSPVAGLGMVLSAFSIPLFVTGMTSGIVVFALGGFFAGLFEVPLESYIQTNSSQSNRGQVMAAMNFVSFLAVLVASGVFFVFSGFLKFSAASSFVLMGLLDLAIVMIMFKKIAAPAFRFISQHVIQPFYEIHYINSALNYREDLALLCRKMPWLRMFILLGESSKFHLFIFKARKKPIDRVLSLFANFDFIYYGKGECSMQAAIIRRRLDELGPKVHPFFVFYTQASYEHFFRSNAFYMLKAQDYTFQDVAMRHETHFKPHFPKIYKRVQLTFLFQELEI